MWKSDLTNKMKHSFFLAAVVSILLYGCPTCVALYGWPEQTIPLSVLAWNQTKDFWTWNLAVSGSGKGTRKESWLDKGAGRSWRRDLDESGWWRDSREVSQQRVGVEPWTDAVDSGDSSREDRVQRRRSSQEMPAFQLLCGIFASNPR